jgi:hypothetical protein
MLVIPNQLTTLAGKYADGLPVARIQEGGARAADGTAAVLAAQIQLWIIVFAWHWGFSFAAGLLFNLFGSGELGYSQLSLERLAPGHIESRSALFPKLDCMIDGALRSIQQFLSIVAVWPGHLCLLVLLQAGAQSVSQPPEPTGTCLYPVMGLQYADWSDVPTLHFGLRAE